MIRPAFRLPRSARRLPFLAALVVASGRPASAQAFDCDGYLTAVVTMPGRCVMPFADSVGQARHLAWHPSGALAVATREAPGILILRDRNGDGVADERLRRGIGGGSGIAWADGWLYAASDEAIWRFRWPSDALVPAAVGERIVTDLPVAGSGYAHNAKGIALGPDGSVYVSIGSVTDNCGTNGRPLPGQFPCEELATRAGIWRFRPPRRAGEPWQGTQVATGLRNAMPLAWDAARGELLLMSHGRDALNQTWGWTNTRSAEEPAELLAALTPGADFGWPYCMPVYRPEAGEAYLRAPEYAEVSAPALDCGRKTPFLHGFPGHWAPMSLAPHPQSPDSIVLVFHGSRGRRPLPEAGHHALIAKHGAYADAQILLRAAPGRPPLRLVGSAWTPEGTLFLSDDTRSRIWLVRPGAPRTR